ncbi:hypothetical protein NLI96_g11463 [Meripilus lineatus]|uniref:Uncharacterized protein n=1 Tax=Meripilus lineatus TaxID=2056292 RepID=A0AAD5URQ6_9APHY|nr:hypothetical protein NLI96_g11463 [Physisporinus lineatus]
MDLAFMNHYDYKRKPVMANIIRTAVFTSGRIPAGAIRGIMSTAHHSSDPQFHVTVQFFDGQGFAFRRVHIPVPYLR